MIIKVDDAHAYWCPFARVDVGRLPVNRVGEGLARDANCVGSLCMAWRWIDRQYKNGYCGLAGIPVAPASGEP
jgi:hypothetical protein